MKLYCAILQKAKGKAKPGFAVEKVEFTLYGDKWCGIVEGFGDDEAFIASQDLLIGSLHTRKNKSYCFAAKRKDAIARMHDYVIAEKAVIDANFDEYFRQINEAY